MKIEYRRPENSMTKFEKLKEGDTFASVDITGEHFMKTGGSKTFNAVRLEDGEVFSFPEKSYVCPINGTLVIE